MRAVDSAALIVCLGGTISRGDAEALALGIADWRNEIGRVGWGTAVFLDGAFTHDAAKANLPAILRHRGLGAVRSL